ncbi:hypothetical protein [Neptunitalea lumnitzerae]|uniref:Uncharacterized protein n=1 Tax=Neptunitalea lumnitzerae TaxID=2965509 RepID=A0ABQ5MH57_9FLAO|nr:hypothetical protein [Neptunitalea sp. Y10]GLB48722.1 hypothetical protein Y10_10900 [Neptunitalea sp. Y10]
MKVLQVCGNLDVPNTEVTVKTMLPSLKHGGSYSYESFYNLSVSDGSTDFYVILGVLKVTSEVVGKLADYKTDAITLQQVTNSKFDYTSTTVENPLSVSVDLAEVGVTDTIHFISIHEDDFVLGDGGEEVLTLIKSNILDNLSSADYKAMVYPKDGDGGPLKTAGCVF